MNHYRLDVEDYSVSVCLTKCKDLIINFFNILYDYYDFCIDNHMT